MLKALLSETLPGIACHAMEAKDLDFIGLSRIVCDDHPAFAGDHVFRDIERKATVIAEGPGVVAPDTSFDGVGAVFDDLEAVPLGDIADGIHFAGTSAEMDGYNGPCA